MRQVEQSPLLTVEDLRVRFNTRGKPLVAVNNSSFQVASGKTLGIVGESGSGKSVSCYSLLGLIDSANAVIESGSAHFGGIDLLSCDEKALKKIRGSEIAMVFQDPMTSLNPYLTIGHQVAEPLIVHGKASKKFAIRRAEEILEQVGIENARRRLKDFPHQFSGGMRQRAMIAMALITDPKLLIADEPTSALDVNVQQQILALIDSMQKMTGVSVIMISHDLDVVRQVADDVIVMQQGNIVERGPVETVLSNPKHGYTKALIDAIPSGKKNTAVPLSAAGSALLSVSNLSVSYGDDHALKQATFELNQGEVLGIVGDSGSGKSTLSRAIVRLEQADVGTIRLNGEALENLDTKTLRHRRKDIQMVFQDPYASLNPRMSIRAMLMEPLMIHGIVRSKSEGLDRIEQLLAEVGMPSTCMDNYPHEFSGGQRQRLAIARALASQPTLLIADEPVSALDVTVQAKVLALLQTIVTERQIGMLLISHDLRVIDSMADRVMEMHQGVLRDKRS